MRRGLARISPALLSQRLKELEASGVVERRPAPGEPGILAYHLTQAGQELAPIINTFGAWGQRWIESEVALNKLDIQLLMWDMRRNLDPQPMPERRSTVMFQYPEQKPALRNWWLVVTPGEPVDLCQIDPGYDVDLYVSCDLRTMTAIYMGHETVKKARDAQRLHLTGDKDLSTHMQTWLGLCSIAKVERMVG